MKKSNFTLSILGLFTLLLFNACSEKANAPNKEMDIPSATSQVDLKSAIDGSWYLVQGNYSGETRKDDSPYQLKLFVDNHFSYVMKSEADGKWDLASSGTFVLEDNIYRETHKYSIGYDDIEANEVIVEWKFEIADDSLKMEGPVKFLIDGVENPEFMGGYNIIKETLVRAKKDNQL